MSRSAPLIPGTRIDDHYTLRSVLGQGGMAVVYLADRDDGGRPVAVKVLEDHVAGTPTRFLNELMLVTRVQHPNVVSVLDFGMTNTHRPYIVMERLEGCSLRTWMARFGPLPQEEAVRLFLGAIDALAVAHALDVVHKDLKPANLFLAETDHGRSLVVLDFGIARAGGCKIDTIEGTPRYLPPEVADGRGASPASDVYQLGLVLAEAVTGRPVVDAHALVDTMRAHRTGVAVPEELRGGPLGAVLKRMLAVDPRKRPADAKALRNALMALDLSAVIRATEVPTLLRERRPAHPPTATARGFAAAVAAALCVGVLVGMAGASLVWTCSGP